MPEKPCRPKVDKVMDESDLQVQIGAMQRIVAILLAQYALNFDEPGEALLQIRELLGAAAAVRSSERTDYLERLNAEIERLLEDAALFVSQRASQSD
jgi:hypothetical protein